MDDLECDKNENRPTMAETGNSAAIREALETVLENHDRMILPEICCPNCGEDFQLRGNLPPDIARKVKAALVAPPRNCDVGTADEQAERFEAECRRYGHCTPCPIHAAWGEFRAGKPKSCQLIWAQMPFAQPKGEVK